MRRKLSLRCATSRSTRRRTARRPPRRRRRASIRTPGSAAPRTPWSCSVSRGCSPTVWCGSTPSIRACSMPLAGRQMGVGTAWLLTVTGAALANLLEGLTGPAEHQAVGASTAVFAALGAMSAHSWRERLQLPQRWARRWGPLVAGVILLGWTGSAGEGTDLVAHVAGFAVGAALGALAALPVVRAALDRTPQWLTGAAALGS